MQKFGISLSTCGQLLDCRFVCQLICTLEQLQRVHALPLTVACATNHAACMSGYAKRAAAFRASVVFITGDLGAVELTASGACEQYLQGSASKVNVDISGASQAALGFRSGMTVHRSAMRQEHCQMIGAAVCGLIS